MRIITVDDDPQALSSITQLAGQLMPDAEFTSYDSSLSALADARKQEIDIAFLDISMPELNGIDLGQYLKELHPFINIIYLTEHREYGFEAMQIHASGYLLKPASEQDIKRELEELRYPEFQKKQKRVFAQTFGNFELFVDGKPVAFKYNRTKEIVALLVNNRGAQTSNGEIVACLWEDEGDPDKKRSYLCNLRQDLQNTFKKMKLNGLLIKQRGSMAIDKERIECDMYDWLEKKQDSRYKYLGDYMNQYSWAEYVHAELDEISYSLYDE